jgi:ABC-type transport system involved in multi-copper enzyme maturation permease subunit
MIPIFSNFFSRFRGQILGWGLSLALLAGFMTLFYDTIAKQKENYLKRMAGYPKGMLAFFSTGSVMEMFTPSGYLNLEFFSCMTLVIGIFAVLEGGGLLVGDEENGTLDLILAHPVSRLALFLGRALAFLAATLAILAIIWLGFVIVVPGTMMDVSAWKPALPMLSLFGLLSLFGALALLLSMLLPSRRLAAMTSGIASVACYFINALAQIDDSLEPVARLLPFHYYRGAGDRRDELAAVGGDAGNHPAARDRCRVAVRAPGYPRGRLWPSHTSIPQAEPGCGGVDRASLRPEAPGLPAKEGSLAIESKEIRSSVDWLLEKEDPGVRYLALRDLCRDREGAARERKRAHTDGPIAAILAKMKPEGYWSGSGPGYTPKYFSTVWSLIQLAELGGSIETDRRIGKACGYFLGHGLAGGGQVTTSGAPSGTVDCLQGNMCWALAALGCEDPRLGGAYDWMARSVTGEGIAPMTDKHAEPRYYAGKCGPGFACGANNKKSCAWGAVKVMRAFSVLPAAKQTPLFRRAAEQGVKFIFSVDPARAAYPSGYTGKPSQSWFKFGFPVFYITDVLQILEVLAGLGLGKDRRAQNLVGLVEGKRAKDGRWLLEQDYAGKTWVNYGPKKKPNKWVTLRALRALGAGA